MVANRPYSVDTKRLILQAFHDHPMAGHLGVTKTLKAINSRFYWLHADREVRDDIRNCPSFVRCKPLVLLNHLVYCNLLRYHCILGTLVH